jgi:hypothetical protein
LRQLKTAIPVIAATERPNRSRSTDPKNSGAKIVQSGIELNVTSDTPAMAANHRDKIVTFSLNLPPGLYGRIHTSHRVGCVRRCGGGVVDKRQQLVVVNNSGIRDVHDVLGPHLKASGKQIA